MWWPPLEYRWRPLLKITRSESSIISFLAPCRKVWLMPTAQVSCSNTTNIGECKTWMQSEFRTWQNSVRKQQAQKCIYNTAAQETAERRAKFGWPLLRNIGAVTKPRCKTCWNLLGCPNPANQSQPLVSQSSSYCEDMCRRCCCLTCFFPIVDTCLSCEDIARQFYAMVCRWQFFA